MTTLCGSLSLHPVSLGAGMHRAGYLALGLDFAYIPFKVEPVSLAGAIAGMRALGIRGFGVSYPHKQAVMPLLDAIDPVAARIGAVNTIVNDAGTLTGHNTDWIGAVRAIDEARSLGGARVLLLGAGGAARAIAFGLRELGSKLTIGNRDLAKAERLAGEVGAEACALADAPARAADADVVVNATTRGMSGTDESTPIDPGALRAGQVVMDIVYKPIETALLRGARARGAQIVHGGRMLLHQAARQFELYTGKPAPLAAMDAALRAAVG